MDNQKRPVPVGPPDLSELSALFDDSSQGHDELKIDVKRLLWGVWQRRGLVVLGTLLSLGVSIAAALVFLEPTWSGQTTLIKKEQQDEFRVGTHGLPFKIQQYAFETLLDTLLLPGTLEQVIKKTGVRILSHKFSRLIDLKVTTESKTFTISVVWNDPRIAAELTNNLAEVFMMRNRALRRREIEGHLVSYRQHLDTAGSRSTRSADALVAFEAANDISDIKTQLIVLLEKRQEVEVDVHQIQGELFAANEETDRLGAHIKQEPKMIVQSSYYVNPMKKNLVSLEWQLAQARGRYTDDNPKVADLLQRIEELKTIIKDGKDAQSPSKTYAFNPVRQNLLVRRYEVGADSYRLAAQLEQLETVQAALGARITRLAQTRQVHDELSYKRDSAMGLQRDLQQRVDSLNVLLRGQLGDFELIERASTPKERRASGRKLLVALSSMIGFSLSLMGVLATEFLYSRIRTLKDLELIFDFGLLCEFDAEMGVQISLDDPTTIPAMRFRRFANDLQIALEQAGSERIAFVSIEGDAGASTAATNTAISMYLKGENTTLVDADLSEKVNPIKVQSSNCVELAQLQDILGVDTQLGSHRLNRLYLITAGDPALRTSESVLAIGGAAMTGLRQQIESVSDWTIYNLPPVLAEEPAFEALKQIGAAVVVVRSDQSCTREVSQTINRMQRHGIQIIAGIITDVPHALTIEGSLSPVRTIMDDCRRLFSCLRHPARIRLFQPQA